MYVSFQKNWRRCETWRKTEKFTNSEERLQWKFLLVLLSSLWLYFQPKANMYQMQSVCLQIMQHLWHSNQGLHLFFMHQKRVSSTFFLHHFFLFSFFLFSLSDRHFLWKLIEMWLLDWYKYNRLLFQHLIHFEMKSNRL